MVKKEHSEFRFTWKGKKVNHIVATIIILLVSISLSFYFNKKWEQDFFWQRMLLFAVIGSFFYLIRPSASIHRIKMSALEKPYQIICWSVLLLTCLIAFYAMGLSDFWTDEGPEYQFQYERTADAFLDGHLYMNLDVSPELSAMDNPYDSVKRSDNAVPFYWDHAFYNNHYYMYFGVVPVILLIIPFRVLGIYLYAYQASQIFVMFIILGMFSLFREIVKRMYPKMPLSAFLSIAVATSWITIWYGVKYPAMYCTANTGGICFAIWGFYFCYKAFILEENRWHFLYTVLGALCSALTFGCRPTIGFFCLILLPLLVSYFKKCDKVTKFIKTFIIFCIPFIVVAALLMTYNYLRFENPFEFGQSYQLTIVDQKDYSNNTIKLSNVLNGLLYHFFEYEEISDVFPFIHHDGNMILFPVLWISLISFGMSKVKKRGTTMIKGLPFMTIIAVTAITAFHVTWAPVIFRRYSMDFIFMICFLVMFGTCGLFWTKINNDKIAFWLSLLCAYTFVICFLLLFVAYDYSIADRQGEMLERVRQIVVFWKR